MHPPSSSHVLRTPQRSPIQGGQRLMLSPLYTMNPGRQQESTPGAFRVRACSLAQGLWFGEAWIVRVAPCGGHQRHNLTHRGLDVKPWGLCCPHDLGSWAGTWRVSVQEGCRQPQASSTIRANSGCRRRTQHTRTQTAGIPSMMAEQQHARFLGASIRTRFLWAGAHAALIAAALTLTACCGGDETVGNCQTSSDCSTGLLCIRNVCTDPSTTDSGVGDGGGDAAPECPDAPLAQMGDLVLNEVLADPPADVDVNMDGTADTNDDEFLEFVNVSSQTVRLSGFELYKNDGAAPETVLKTECLGPGEALVIFGGLESGAAAPAIPGARVEIADGSMQLNNSGATITLTDTEANVVVEVH
ncbi:MAG: hypothetical protein CMH57_06035 [Myxococcales bacterium]|nr:hypothetical protein [Myxococcales bacterium]